VVSRHVEKSILLLLLKPFGPFDVKMALSAVLVDAAPIRDNAQVVV
jgi:hypothetical protein